MLAGIQRGMVTTRSPGPSRQRTSFLAHRLPSAFSMKQRRQCPQKDRDIRPSATAVDQFEVHRRALRKLDGAPPASLPDPRDSRLHRKQLIRPTAVVSNYFCARQWPRANQRHFSARDMPELWKFIDRMAPHELRETAGDAKIGRILRASRRLRDNILHPSVLARFRCLTTPHGPQLPNPK
jgi:hypothetical protein